MSMPPAMSVILLDRLLWAPVGCFEDFAVAHAGDPRAQRGPQFVGGDLVTVRLGRRDRVSDLEHVVVFHAATPNSSAWIAVSRSATSMRRMSLPIAARMSASVPARSGLIFFTATI